MCSMPARVNRPDHLQQRRSAGRQVKFGGRSVEGNLALAAFGRDHGQVPRRRVHVLKQRHAIAQASAVGRAGPCHGHENMRVRSARASRCGLAATVAGKDGNVVADIGEQGRGHDRQRHGVDCPRCCLGDTDPGRLFVVAPKGVDFGIHRAAADHDARRADSGVVRLCRPNSDGGDHHAGQDEPRPRGHEGIAGGSLRSLITACRPCS